MPPARCTRTTPTPSLAPPASLEVSRSLARLAGERACAASLCCRARTAGLFSLSARRSTASSPHRQSWWSRGRPRRCRARAFTPRRRHVQTLAARSTSLPARRVARCVRRAGRWRCSTSRRRLRHGAGEPLGRMRVLCPAAGEAWRRVGLAWPRAWERCGSPALQRVRVQGRRRRRRQSRPRGQSATARSGAWPLPPPTAPSRSGTCGVRATGGLRRR
mmetsp:Transcript_23699/g.74669  ORF Transcript_23699/g.74669 Transcript_23699/m.74669 type:complete len:218 (+) Transcript_23699:137-790(+)